MQTSDLAEEAKVIKFNLEEYPFIKKFLGNIINQRLKIECFTHGMLTANLLELTELTKLDLSRLECILKFGESDCRGFKQIFQGKGLSKQTEIADGQIIDILAEVKAFEFLHNQDFHDIANIKRVAGVRTVDFIAQRNGRNYAIEATRLGLAQSAEKQPAHAYEVDTISYTKCGDANGFRISMMTQGLNVCRLKSEISDAISSKYLQMKEFCKSRTDIQMGMLFISSGRDYFVMGKYENKEYEITPNQDFLTVLTDIWKSPAQEDLKDYLHHVVITRGKDLNRAIIYPSLRNKG